MYLSLLFLTPYISDPLSTIKLYHSAAVIQPQFGPLG